MKGIPCETPRSSAHRLVLLGLLIGSAWRGHRRSPRIRGHRSRTGRGHAVQLRLRHVHHFFAGISAHSTGCSTAALEEGDSRSPTERPPRRFDSGGQPRGRRRSRRLPRPPRRPAGRGLEPARALRRTPVPTAMRRQRRRRDPNRRAGNHGMFMKLFNRLYEGWVGAVWPMIAQSDLGKGNQQVEPEGTPITRRSWAARPVRSTSIDRSRLRAPGTRRARSPSLRLKGTADPTTPASPKATVALTTPASPTTRGGRLGQRRIATILRPNGAEGEGAANGRPSPRVSTKSRNPEDRFDDYRSDVTLEPTANTRWRDDVDG